MANKTPIRAVFNDAGTATGLSEFQSGDTIGLTHGGLGASLSLGTAGQVLKVNSSANALEFGVVEAIVNIDNATNLTSAINNSVTSVVVDNVSNLVAGNLIRIDSELLSISSISNNTLTVVRAAKSTSRPRRAQRYW